MIAGFSAVLLCATPASARRQLRQEDLHYGLPAFNAKFNTQAPNLFGGDDHFHRRLFEHEAALPPNKLQTYMATLHPSKLGVTPELTKSLEQRGGLTLHTVVSGDLLMHGTRDHADALRNQPEVKTVVPLLPELKVTPHFGKMLPDSNATSSRTTSLLVRLIPHERHEHLRLPAAKLVAEFASAIARACADEASMWKGKRACSAAGTSAAPTVAYDGERTIVVRRVERTEAQAVAELLARLPEALWVEPVPIYRSLGLPPTKAAPRGRRRLNADAATITQSGSNPPGGGVPIGTTPISDMGLHGEDEIIGVGDSGLDSGHCFFEDKTGGEAATQTYGPTHRKIVAYRPYADGEATGQRDHGTHVVGSILGKSSTPGAEGANNDGMAPAARVSFTDIGMPEGNLAIPNDMVNNFFNVDYGASRGSAD